MRRKQLLIPLLVLVLTIFFFRPGQELEQYMEIKSNGNVVSDDVEVFQMAPARRPLNPKKKLPSITKAEINLLRTSLPDKMEVKEEAAESPHTTPRSLIVFAETLGPLIEKGLNNVVDAKLLSEDLQDCVLSEAISIPARTLCLSSMEKLVEVHPELKGKMEIIRNGAPRKVIKLDQSVKGLRK